MNPAPTDDFDHYGQSASSRLPEISAVSHWMSNWASTANRFHHNLILLGDFNIDRSGSPLWQALTASGLTLPKELETVKRSIFINDGDDQYYDKIVWFCDGAGKKALTLSYRNAGSFDFLPYLYREEEMSKRSVSYRISDHYPLWVEFGRG